ncbi:MAG: hypothetical protein HQL52_02200 [Magnetococcales bacterium]|nr:hypothetical protein [Magnetococcales bacterium]
MIVRFIKWLFRNIGPYVLGISVGIGFAYLLIIFVAQTEIPINMDNLTRYIPSLSVEPETLITPPEPPTSEPPPAKHTPPPVAAVEAPVETPVEAPVAPPSPAEPAETVGVAGMGVDPAWTAQAAAENQATTTPSTELPNELSLPITPVVTQSSQAQKSTPAAKGSGLAYTPAVKSPAKSKKSTAKKVSCGTPPSQPGFAMDRYLSCQWYRHCLDRLDRARRMISRGRDLCPKSGANAQQCRNYYRSLESRYQPEMCNQWRGYSAIGG